MVRDSEAFLKMEARGQFVLRYMCLEKQDSIASTGHHRAAMVGVAGNQPAVPYPDNPNGAMGNVAGICDATGRVFGLMPHPESFYDRTQHPRWTREPRREAGDGLRVFQNAVRYFV